MTTRPRLFEQQEVEALLREHGVSEDFISPTISFMRLVIPLLIKKVGAEGIVETIEQASNKWGLPEQPPGWRRTMAKHIFTWADASIDQYEANRFGANDEMIPG